MNLLILVLVLYAIYLFIQVSIYKETDYHSQTQNSYFSVRFDKGKLGEYYTYKYLDKLVGYRKFLFNVYLPKNNGETTEIDVILLHESGIYVFESKNYSGWIYGTETHAKWTQTLSNGKGRVNKNHFPNPILQNKVHIKWLSAFLQDKTIPLYSYIIFSDRCTLKNIKLTSNDHCVINRYNILKSVNENVSVVGQRLTPEKIDELYNKLYPLTQVSAEQKQEHIQNIIENHSKGKYERRATKHYSQETPLNNIEIEDSNKNSCVSGNSDETEKNAESSTKIDEEVVERTVENNVVAVESSVKNDGEAVESSAGNDVEAVEEKLCPKCGSLLVRRTAKRGERKGQSFYGCSNYPKCRYIENL